MRVRRRLVASLAAAVVATAPAGCTGSHVPPRDAGFAWRSRALPAPAGQRVLVRAATWCAGAWVVVGATAEPQGRTRPAVWTSTDARSWQVVRLRPGRDFYTSREILGSVACSRGRLAVLGAKSGGAHGMPRTATWRQLPDGSLAAVHAPYLLFGGTQSVDVARLVGGPRGYLITGTRTSGAAVWQSATGASFRLYDGVPGLATDAQLRTQATDAVSTRHGWLVAGEATGSTGRLRAVVWRGDRAGPWTVHGLPGGSRVSTADRLVDTSAGPDAAGLLDGGFGVWALRDGSWRLMERFGAVDPDGSAAPYISGLVAPGGRPAATYSDGVRFRLWVGADVPMPVDVPVDGDRTATLAAHGRQLLLLTDDDHTSRVWLTTV